MAGILRESIKDMGSIDLWILSKGIKSIFNKDGKK